MHVRVLLLLFALVVCATADFNETALVEFYSGVQDWFKFSRRFDISRECEDNLPLRMAYFTRHAGTLWDFVGIATHLGVSWTTLHPGLIFALTPSRPDSYESDYELAHSKWRAAGQMYCHIADILMFGDITADARPLLQGNCTTPIILQVTNRFDIGVRDQERYYSLMAEVAKWRNVWWVCNNPYDKLYLEMKGVTLPPERTMVLRPVGLCLLPRPAPETYVAREDKIAFVHHSAKKHLENTFILPWIQQEGLSQYLAEHAGNYGGPAVLAQHRGVIQVPYQVSVMKMYEGLAAGAVFIIPSPNFFRTLLLKLSFDQMAFCCRDLVETRPEDWQEYIDWYNEDFKYSHVFYDSWDELKAIIKGEGIYNQHFFQSKKKTSLEMMDRIRRETLEGYSKVYAAARQLACETYNKPDFWSAGMGRHVIGGRAA